MIYDAKVMENKKIAEEIYRLKLDAGKRFRAKPGQFINVRVADSFQPLLRRPFSIFDLNDGKVEIVYKVIGEGTDLLSGKKTSDIVNFIGPLGNPYPGIGNREMGFGKGKNPKIILAGGGTGIASLHFLAKELKKKKIKFTILQGAKNKKQVILPKEFKKLGCIFTTDEGSFGEKGFVSDVLKNMVKDNTIIYACGPKPMLRAINKIAASKKNVKAMASLEEYMGCGIGACLSCVVDVGGEYIRVCKEGTVFELDKISF